MSYIQFAIASIVDANTGHGLVYNGGKIDYAAAASRGRGIRARTIVALFGSIKHRLAKTIASIRENQVKKRNLRLLAGLDDHLLEDIGITRGEVIAVQMGQIDMRRLIARHSKNREATRLRPTATTRDIGNTVRRDALNEAVFARAKCA